MLIVAKGIVVHNGKEYHSGELINDTTDKQCDRLVSLGVCKYIPDQSAAAAGAEPDAPAGKNIPASTGDAEKQSDTGALHLDVDPASAIQTGKKK